MKLRRVQARDFLGFQRGCLDASESSGEADWIGSSERFNEPDLLWDELRKLRAPDNVTACDWPDPEDVSRRLMRFRPAGRKRSLEHTLNGVRHQPVARGGGVQIVGGVDEQIDIVGPCCCCARIDEAEP